jgi:hypothetical protein
MYKYYKMISMCHAAIHRCQICGRGACREHCYERQTPETELQLGVCNRCHMRVLQDRLVKVQHSLVRYNTLIIVVTLL